MDVGHYSVLPLKPDADVPPLPGLRWMNAGKVMAGKIARRRADGDANEFKGA
jgi:hypothetical protein